MAQTVAGIKDKYNELISNRESQKGRLEMKAAEEWITEMINRNMNHWII